MSGIDVIPAKYRDLRLDDLDRDEDNRTAIEAAEAWATDALVQAPSTGLVLRGEPGVGKTAILAAMIATACDELPRMTVGWTTEGGLRSGYLRQMELMDLMKKMTEIDDDTDELIEHRERSQRLWEWSHQTDVLVIDDLGRSIGAGNTAWLISSLDQLVRTRGDAGLCTCFTTNMSNEDLKYRYGEPFMSYLRDITRGITVRGADRRRS